MSWNTVNAIWDNMLALIHVIVGGISCIGLIIVWYKIYVEHKLIRNKWVLIYSIFGVILQSITSFSISIYYANLIIGFELFIVIDVWEFFQSFGHAFTYLLFIKRIQITFENTKYQYPPFIYIILYILIILFVLIQFIHIILNYAFYSEIDNIKTENIISSIEITSTQYNITKLITILLSALIDAILSISFLTLLFKKLFQLTFDIAIIGYNEPEKLKWAESASQSAVKLKKNSICINDNDLNLNESIINGASKVTVLSSFTVITAQIMLIWLGLMFITHNASTWNYWMLYLSFRNLSNSLCIILSFEFMTKWYLKSCGICDDCCAIICEYSIRKHLRNSIKDELKLTLLSHQSSL